MKKSVVRFPSPSVLRTCLFALACLTFSSVGYASPQPSEANNVHFCLPIDFEEMRESDSLYAARKQAFDLNVGESRTVRLIYFLPNDRPFRAEVVDSMKVAIRRIQTFYGDQMQVHGYGNKTFRFETDAHGEPMVHRVDGQHPDSHYLDNTSLAMNDEIEQVFDLYANVYLLVIDNSIYAIVNRSRGAGGRGGRQGKNADYALVHGGFSFRTAAHELGHAFGLSHDFNDDAYIMSWGGGQQRSLSACNAEFLAVHPYFDPSVEAQEAPPPTIELISQIAYPAGSRSVSVQLEVSDPEGLHQVLLFVVGEVKACRGLAGVRDAVVEFDYNGVIPSDGLRSLSNPDVHPILAKAVDTDGNVGYSYFNLWEISPQHIATLEGHKGYVTSVVFSPDGTALASGAFDSTIRLWDVATRTNTATLEEHTGSIESVAFSPDGTTLASGSRDRTVKLWDVATRTNIATLEGHEFGVRSVAISPDGTTLASGSWDETVKLWDVATGRNIATLRHPYIVNSVSFSPDGTTLASGSWGGTSSADAGTVWLWDVSTRRNIATLEGHKGPVTSVVFSPDGTTLASGADDSTIRLWDVATRTNIATLEGHESWVRSVAISPDGTTLASGSLDETVKLWDVATGRNIATYRHIDKHSGQLQFVYSVAFSPNGTTLASGAGSWDNGTINLWDVSGWIRPRPQTLVKISGDNQQGTPGATLANPLVVEVRDQYDHPLPDTQVTFTVTAGGGRLSGRFTVEHATTGANGRAENTLTLGSNPGPNIVEVSVAGLEPVTFNAVGVGTSTSIMGGDYRTWHLPDGAIVRLGKGAIGAVAFSRDFQRLAVASGIGVWLYDVATFRELALFTGHTGRVETVAFSPNGTMLASVSNIDTGLFYGGTLNLWNVATGENIATLEGHTELVFSVAFSPDGTTLASGSLGDVNLWDVTTQTNIATLSGHTEWVFSVAFSSDGNTLASGSQEGTVKLWDVATRTNTATLRHGTGFEGSIRSVAFSPDGTTLASGAWDGTLKLWNVTTGENIATLRHPYIVVSVSFSPDGTTLASGSGSKIYLWDVKAGINLATIEGHIGRANSVSFSRDGTLLASGSRDRTVKLWDVATRENIATFRHTSEVSSVAFSPDGTTLATGPQDRAVNLWDVATGRNIATLWGHTNSVAFSPDGTLLASGSRDRTVKLWDVATRENIATLEGHASFVRSIAFSPDGTQFASWSLDGTVLLWDLSALGLGVSSRATFSLSLDGDGAAGDQAITSLDVSPGSVVSIQVFGKDIQGATGVSMRFEYDAAQVLYEGFDPGGVLQDARVLSVPDTNSTSTSIEISMVTLIGQPAPDSGLVGSIRFRTKDAFSGTTLRLVLAELGRGDQLESMTLLDTSVTLQVAEILSSDFNGDGMVDFDDFYLFAGQFGASRGNVRYEAKYDLDEDGAIGFGDFLIFAGDFGNGMS